MQFDGVRKVLEMYDIPPEQCLACGDGENDLEMLRAVGIGVAMGNSPEMVRRAVKHVTDTNDNAGVRIIHSVDIFFVFGSHLCLSGGKSH